MIQLKTKYNIRVINLSLGRPAYESYTLDPLCQAVEAAWKAGIVVVVAAGNDGRDNTYGTNGYGTISAPGNDPFVITVGAMDTQGTPSPADDQIASYSSKGPTFYDQVVKPDLVAPGNRIILARYTAGLELEPSLSRQRDSQFSVPEEWKQYRFGHILRFERHQHGDADCEQRGGSVAAEIPEPHARSGQGAPDEDGQQKLRSLQQHCRPFYRPGL